MLWKQMTSFFPNHLEPTSQKSKPHSLNNHKMAYIKQHIVNDHELNPCSTMCFIQVVFNTNQMYFLAPPMVPHRDFGHVTVLICELVNI